MMVFSKFPLPRTNKSLLIYGVISSVSLSVISIYYYYVKKFRNTSENKELLPQCFVADHVHMKDRDFVEKWLTEMVEDGKDEIQIIADFDRTLSGYMRDGKSNPTTHNTLEVSSHMPAWFKEHANQLFSTYYPLEIDHKLTATEKYPLMTEWWEKNHSLISKANLTRHTLECIVKEVDIHLRDGVDWLLRQLHKHNIPMLVFSAGLGDVIELTLRNKRLMFENIKVVSNFMDFNHHDVQVGFKGDIVHSLSKGESAVHKSDYFEKQGKRKNIILLGDSLGDVYMASGASASQRILKIGFLNVKIEESLAQFMESYDVVLVSDETMTLPNEIIKCVITNGSWEYNSGC